MAVRLKTLANMIETRLLRVKSSKRDEKRTMFGSLLVTKGVTRQRKSPK